MRDYSIGHRLILLRQRNPLIWAAEEDFNTLPCEQQIMWLIEACYTCAQSYAYRKKLESDPTRWLLFKNKRLVSKWAELRAHYTADTWVLEFAKFRNYLAQSKITTEFEHKRDGFPFMPVAPSKDADGRSLGAPYDATLIQFLIRSMHKTEAEALEYPLALAQAHFLAHLEREGALKILNGSEMDFRETSRAQDEKAAKDAGFNTVEEHTAFVLEENRKAKEAALTAKK